MLIKKELKKEYGTLNVTIPIVIIILEQTKKTCKKFMQSRLFLPNKSTFVVCTFGRKEGKIAV